MIKFVKDALQGTMYNNDGQITTHDSAKKWFDSGHGGNRYICIILEVLSENEQ